MSGSQTQTRVRYWGLLMAPLLSFLISILVVLTMFLAPVPHLKVPLIGATLISVAAGIGMIRANISKGWGWHGQN